jgi:hypothetical protein
MSSSSEAHDKSGSNAHAHGLSLFPQGKKFLLTALEKRTVKLAWSGMVSCGLAKSE